MPAPQRSGQTLASAPAGEALIALPMKHGLAHLGSVRLLLLIFIVVFLVAAIAALAAPGDWYAGLNKPAWTPANSVFGPVWTVLYVLTGLAGWLIFANAPGTKARRMWSAKLLLSAIWSWLFFGVQSPGLALLDILALQAVCILLIISLLREVFPWSRLAAILLIPYWLWISFAGALNTAIWQLN